MRNYFNHIHKKPVLNGNLVGQVSKCQGGLAPTIRKILQTTSCGGTVIGANFNTLPSDGDNVNLNYSRESFVSKIEKFNELQKWYNDNKEVCDQVLKGDYSHFEPLFPSAPSEPSAPSAPA